jgi:integrase
MTWLEVDRERKPSTLSDYRSILRAHLLPAFGELAIEDISPAHIERFRIELGPIMANRTKIKILTVLYGVLERARKKHRLPTNPARDMEKPTLRRRAGIDVFSVEEVMALVRAADSEQDATIFLLAAFTGLRRGELVALRWRDIDFPGKAIRVVASYGEGGLTTPKSGKVRSVPMAPEVASALARLSSRAEWTGDDDLVFLGLTGGFLDASALYRRYKAALRRAGLRNLRFHDLRHTFGTRAITRASILQVKEWMGHADVDTTMQYLHYAPRTQDAALLADAFRSEGAPRPVSAGDPDPAAR